MKKEIGIGEAYFYDDEQLLKHFTGLIGTYLQQVEFLEEIEVKIQPFKDKTGKQKYRTIFNRTYKMGRPKVNLFAH